jgi:hypothetical protein
MKNNIKRTLFLLCLLLSASIFAQNSVKKDVKLAELPAGAVVSGGLTWTRNNTTVSGGESSWYAGYEACNNLTAQGFPVGSWRLPTKDELLALYEAGNGALSSAGWTLSYTWSSSTNAVGDHYFVGLFRPRVGPDNGSIRCYVTCVR